MESNFNDTENNDKFKLIQNRIKYYYESVFNVEIITLFCKKDILKELMNRNDLNDWYKSDNNMNFKFNVLIKDSNKIIFKYKIFKIEYDSLEYKKINNKWQHCSFDETLYYFIDKKLCEYCKSKYLNKKNGKFNDFLEKNNNINNKYREWLENKNNIN